jgi:hypothetical protein
MKTKKNNKSINNNKNNVTGASESAPTVAKSPNKQNKMSIKFKKKEQQIHEQKKQDVVEDSIVVVIELDVGHFLKGVK